MSDVKAGKGRDVPKHLRDAHYSGAAKLGHGKGYQYPHDDDTGYVAQQYRPDEVADVTYYDPSPHGFEAEVRRRLAARGTAPDEAGDGAGSDASTGN